MVLKPVGEQIRITWGDLLHPRVSLWRGACACVLGRLRGPVFPFPDLRHGDRPGRGHWEWVLSQPARRAEEPLHSFQQYCSLKQLHGLGGRDLCSNSLLYCSFPLFAVFHYYKYACI